MSVMHYRQSEIAQERLLRMDKQTFADQVMSREQMLYRVARSLLASNEDCKDALQEAVMRAWAARHSLKDEQFFATWLTRILINTCKAIRRKQKKYLLFYNVQAGVAVEAPDVGIQYALDGLPEKQRLPVVLHYMEGYSLKEVAVMLKLSQSTLRGRLYQAMQRLRLELDEEELGK